MRTKLQNKKGFTLAELLIVVAIIAVLVAVSIPVFTTQLRKAELSTDLANARAAYAENVTTKMANNSYTTSGKIALGSLQASLKNTTATVTSNKVTLTHKKQSSLKASFSYDADVTIKAIK